MAGKDDPVSDDPALLCLFTYWLTGRISLQQARIVHDDLGRPDSRIFATVSSLDHAAQTLLGHGPRPQGPDREPARRHASWSGRFPRGSRGDDTPDRS